MNVTDKQVDAAQDTYDMFAMSGVCDRNAIRKSIEAAMQAAPAAEQEPANLRASADMIWRDNDAIVPANEFKRWLSVLAPLYYHPQPKRKPLSEENLVLIWNNSTKDIPYEHFQAVFRFAEKAHGIGE